MEQSFVEQIPRPSLLRVAKNALIDMIPSSALWAKTGTNRRLFDLRGTLPRNPVPNPHSVPMSARPDLEKLNESFTKQEKYLGIALKAASLITDGLFLSLGGLAAASGHFDQAGMALTADVLFKEFNHGVTRYFFQNSLK